MKSENCCGIAQPQKGTVSHRSRQYQDCRRIAQKKNGAAEGTRTPDPIITNDVLYQLSYSGILLCARGY
jgi:hypothetical protein